MENKLNQIEVECGRYYIDENGVYHYEGDATANGWCYKDYSAWKNNKGVIYIGEYELEYHFSAEEDEETNFWTKESWVNCVRAIIEQEYSNEPDINEMLSNDDFITGLAYDCFDSCDWQDLSTMFAEYDYNGDWVLDNWQDYKERNGLNP